MDRQALWRSADLWPVGGGSSHFKIVEALTYLQQHFADPAMRLSAAAQHIALSPTHLARLLKSTTGLTFLQHLRRLRVQHAEHLLMTTMLSVKEVAGACGYGGGGSFARDFRRVHGCAPSAWRARRRVAQELRARVTDCGAIARTESCS